MIDSYGFTRSDNEDIKTYEDFLSKYHHTLNHRSSRWTALLSDSMPDKDSKKLKRFIRKGIPSEHRPSMWMCLSGAERRMQENKGLYHSLLNDQHDPLLVDTIKKDIHRTFPDNIYFRGEEVNKEVNKEIQTTKEDSQKEENNKEMTEDVAEGMKTRDDGKKEVKETTDEGRKEVKETTDEGRKEVKETTDEGRKEVKETTDEGRKEVKETTDEGRKEERDRVSEKNKRGALYNVLLAVSHKNTHTGYCQGMNFVTGLLLLVVKDEEKVFWLVDTLINEILLEYYAQDMSGVKVDCEVLGQLVRMKCPEVHAMAESMGCVWPLVATKWFICLFVDVLPTETVLRLWDCLFLEGDKILFRVCITLIKRSTHSILHSSHFGQFMDAMKAMTKDPITLDCHKFIESIFKEPGSFPKSLIERLRLEYKKRDALGEL